MIDGKIRKDAPVGQLYDLKSDPYQKTNVYSKNPKIVKEMDEILKQYREKIAPGKRIGWIN